MINTRPLQPVLSKPESFGRPWQCAKTEARPGRSKSDNRSRYDRTSANERPDSCRFGQFSYRSMGVTRIGPLFGALPSAEGRVKGAAVIHRESIRDKRKRKTREGACENSSLRNGGQQPEGIFVRAFFLPWWIQRYTVASYGCSSEIH